MDVVRLEYPFSGPWLVQNSPGSRIPSHGTHAYGTTHAIDFVPVDSLGRSAPFTVSSLIRPEPARRFPGWGRTVLAPIRGVVVATRGSDPDHDAFRGLPSVLYALTQRRRAAAGCVALAGNHVVIQADPRVFVALCHLRRGSVTVGPGDSVDPGQPVAQCGNSGNSTEPHLHVQATDRLDPGSATSLVITFPGGLPRNGDVLTLA